MMASETCAQRGGGGGGGAGRAAGQAAAAGAAAAAERAVRAAPTSKDRAWLPAASASQPASEAAAHLPVGCHQVHRQDGAVKAGARVEHLRSNKMGRRPIRLLHAGGTSTRPALDALLTATSPASRNRTPGAQQRPPPTEGASAVTTYHVEDVQPILAPGNLQVELAEDAAAAGGWVGWVAGLRSRSDAEPVLPR
jgi:hypothetical protein